MSEVHTVACTHEGAKAPKSLWGHAAVILLIVFVPALLAWGLTMLQH